VDELFSQFLFKALLVRCFDLQPLVVSVLFSISQDLLSLSLVTLIFLFLKLDELLLQESPLLVWREATYEILLAYAYFLHEFDLFLSKLLSGGLP
jgi:hypothetical protein